jgi:polynucleotide 5'-hydroxyl-kinase GRC3/NOL9
METGEGNQPMQLRDAPVTWREGIERLAAASGVVVLLGETDVGKSTLTLEAANAAVRAGRRVALLDTDIGQGEIGPPGTLGLARLELPAAVLSDLQPRALAFVGDTSPYGHLLHLVQGTCRLVRHAVHRDAEVVFVDTSGLVHGRMAERLKLAKLAALDPALVVIVQRGEEMRRLAAVVAGAAEAPLLQVEAAPEVRRKSAAYRRARRAGRLRRYLERAKLHWIPAAQVQVLEGWLYTGETVPTARLAFAAELLQAPVPYGEVTPDGIFLAVGARPHRPGIDRLPEVFGRRRVTLTPVPHLQHLLVGLFGPGGHTLGVGLLEQVDFDRASFGVLTPLHAVDQVCQVQFGRLRVRPDGSEITHLRPGDL